MGIWIMATLMQMLMWLSMSPLLTTIMEELHLNYSRGGFLNIIVMVVSGIALFAGSFLVKHLGVKKGMVLAMGFYSIAGIIMFLAHHFLVLLFARILVGVGYGLITSLGGALVMIWFPAREQSYMNTINIIVINLGITLAYTITIPMLNVLKSWNNIYLVFAVIAMAVTGLWAVFGRAHDSEVLLDQHLTPISKTIGIFEAGSKKEVWLLAFAFFGNVMAFNVFSTFLPAYFQEQRGFDLSMSSNLTGLLSVAGMTGGVVCGFGSSYLKIRKPFLWTSMLMIMTGIITTMLGKSTILSGFGICLVGFGCSAFPPIAATILMEIKGSTPEMVAGGLALIMGTNQLLVILCPIIFNALVPRINMTNAFLSFAAPLAISTILMLIIKETGPGRIRVKI